MKDKIRVNHEEWIKQTLERIIKKRADLSPYLLHLTRDYNHETADRNIVNIFNSRAIQARNVDCYKKNLLLNDTMEDRFKVLSLTETPFKQIPQLTDEKIVRKIQLKPFGIAFTRDFIIKKNGSPVIYTYNQHQLDYYEARMQEYVSKVKVDALNIDDSYCNIGAFVKKIDSREDFHWEREWKVRKDLAFTEDDVFCIVVPNRPISLQIYTKLEHKTSHLVQFYLVEEDEFVLYTRWTSGSPGNFHLNYYEIELLEEPEFSFNNKYLGSKEITMEMVREYNLASKQSPTSK